MYQTEILNEFLGKYTEEILDELSKNLRLSCKIQEKLFEGAPEEIPSGTSAVISCGTLERKFDQKILNGVIK